MISKEVSESLELFSIENQISLETIKERYHTLIKNCHPDKNPDKSLWAHQMAQKINTAYEILIRHLDEIKQAAKSRVLSIKQANKAIMIGDENLRDAVIIGLLRRKAKSSWGQRFRKNIILCYQVLLKAPPNLKNNFFMELFSVFLKSTDPLSPKSLPLFRNTTRFFKYVHKAHYLLETGIRNFYHFQNQLSSRSYVTIPSSFLEEAIHLYKYLKPQLTKDLAENLDYRIILSDLFIKRLNQKELR